MICGADHIFSVNFILPRGEKASLSLKEKYLSEYNTQNCDEIDMYQINLEIAQKIGKELYGDKTEEDFVEETLDEKQINEDLKQTTLIENKQSINEQTSQNIINTENADIVQ